MPANLLFALFWRVDPSLPPPAVPVLTRVILIFLCEMVPGIAGAVLVLATGKFPGMLPASPVLLYTGWAVVVGILIGCSLFAANLIASTEAESLRTTRRNEAFTFMICSQLVIAPIFGISMMFLFSNAF